MGNDRVVLRLMATTALALIAMTVPGHAETMRAGAEPQGAQLAQMPSQESWRFDIPAQPLRGALNAFGRQADLQVTVDAAVTADIQAQAVSGAFAPDEALRRMLAGTGITWRYTDARTVMLSKIAGPSGALMLDPISVEGRGASRDPGATEGTGSYSGSRVTVGSKSGDSIREIPQSVSVVTRQRMDDQNLTTLQDAMKQTTGMTVQRFDGSGNFNTINARGYQADSILLDGVVTSFNANQATSLDTAIYDRIEVLRGPAGLFQGAGEPGATINLVRKRPGMEFDASGAVSVGSWNSYRGEGDVTIPLVESGQARARIVALRDQRDSFIDYVENNKSLAYGTVEVDLTEATTLSMGATYQEIDSVIDQGLPAYADGRLADVDRSTFAGAPWNLQDLTTADFFTELNHRLDNGGHLQASARRVEQEMLYRGARANGAIDPVTGDFAIQTVEYGFNRDTTAFDAHAATPVSFGGLTHKLLVGTDYRTFKDTTTSLSFGPNYTSNIFNPDYALPEPDFAPYTPTSTEQEQYGVYGQVHLKPIEWGTIILGGRMSWWEANSATSNQSVDAEVTPFAGLTIDLNDQFSVYGSYASIFQPQNARTVSGSFLNPRTGNQYEVGVKAELFGGNALGHVALFRIEDENRAMTDPDDPLFSIAAGEVRSEGLEAEVSGSLLPGWEVFAGYAYTTTEYLTAPISSQGQPFSHARAQLQFVEQIQLLRRRARRS